MPQLFEPNTKYPLAYCLCFFNMVPRKHQFRVLIYNASFQHWLKQNHSGQPDLELSRVRCVCAKKEGNSVCKPGHGLL